MTQLAIAPTPRQTTDIAMHPLVRELILHTQPELLEESGENSAVVQAILRYVEHQSSLWPPSASPVLHLALKGLMKMRKKCCLDHLEISIEWRKAQILKKMGALLPPEQ